MPDIITPEKLKEGQQTSTPTFIEQVRTQSFRDILNEKPEDKKPENLVDDSAEKERIAAKQAEEKRDLDEKRRREEQENLARKTAEEIINKQKADEEKRIREKEEAEKEVKRVEDLKPAWQKDPTRPKDPKTGEPLPKSYSEIFEEAKRAAKEEALLEWEKREQQRLGEIEKTKQSETAKQAEQARINEEWKTRIDNQIKEELNDLYTSNKMPKIMDEKNPNDDGVKARNELFKQGREINEDRIKRGLPPIQSIKLIYYEHYKAPKPPAGGNAPVAGNTPPAAPAASEMEYNWARDHGKSPRQLMLEVRKAMGAK